MEINTRFATIQDINQVYDIEKECFNESERLEKNIFYFFLLNNKGEIFLVVETKPENGKPELIGFIVSYLNSQENYEIITINVLKKHRNKGIATELMLGLEKEIQTRLKTIINKNVITIELVVYELNKPAIKLYQKLGYKNVENIPKYYAGTRNGIRMNKKISQKR
ncbi:MAG: GNAT family N-acetyltransferase [Asgard group archaeon]|nr:GNAT family N-acetyltransferase [Asgard group archaeon]